MANDTFRCFWVERRADGEIHRSVVERPVEELPPGEVLIRVEYSSLNYKDALAANGHAGVVRQLPHVPGIDAAGVVVESSDPRFQAGDKVIATSYEIGAGQWGGWSERLRVPADWVLPLPAGLTTFDAMALGTAGLTAALSTAALQHAGVAPGDEEVVVTGATGGVGSLSVMLLAKLGYKVAAVTGKQQSSDDLKKWGASRVLRRDELLVSADRPLLSAKYAGGIDTVGGLMLATLLRQIRNYGAVAACGLVGGADLPITVHPFILRGISLLGISTAWTPRPRRDEIWAKLAGEWSLPLASELVQRVSLGDLEERIQQILAGQMLGRVVVDLQA